MPPKPLEQLVQRADDVLKGRGSGLEDWRDALEMYQQAAQMGSGRAFSRIGRMYINGTGLKRNPEKGIQHFKKAVSLGYLEDYDLLMGSYLELGEQQSAQTAFKHYLSSTAAMQMGPDNFILRSNLILLMSRYGFSLSYNLLDFHLQQCRLYAGIELILPKDTPYDTRETMRQMVISTKAVWPALQKQLSKLGIKIESCEECIEKLKVDRQIAEEQEKFSEQNRALASNFLEKMKQLARVFKFTDVSSMLEKIEKPIAIWKNFSRDMIEENDLISDLSHHALISNDNSPSSSVILYCFLAEIGHSESAEDLCRIFVDYNLKLFNPFIASHLLYRYALLDAEIVHTMTEYILRETTLVANYFEIDELPEARHKARAFEFLIAAGHLDHCQPYLDMLMDEQCPLHDPHRAMKVKTLLLKSPS